MYAAGTANVYSTSAQRLRRLMVRAIARNFGSSPKSLTAMPCKKWNEIVISTNSNAYRAVVKEFRRFSARKAVRKGMSDTKNRNNRLVQMIDGRARST